LQLIGDQRFSLDVMRPMDLAAVWALGDEEYVLDVLSHGVQVADNRHKATALSLSTQGIEGFSKRVGVERSEPFIEEKCFQTAASAPSEFHECEGEGEACEERL